MPEGVAVENALVCIADEAVRHFVGSVESVVYPKQMIDKNSQLVTINPTMFAPVGTAVTYRPSPMMNASPEQVVSDTGSRRLL